MTSISISIVNRSVFIVQEIVQDYEDTLEDLRGFCKHISEEVGTNWNDNMDELHRKLWELETSSVISEIDNFSLSSLENSAPGIGGLRLRRHIDQVYFYPIFILIIEQPLL